MRRGGIGGAGRGDEEEADQRQLDVGGEVGVQGELKMEAWAAGAVKLTDRT